MPSFPGVVTMKRVVAMRLPALIDVSNRPPLRVELWKTQTMTDQWMFLSAVLAMGIVVAAVSGYFVFQGESLIAILFGLPPTIAIAGSLWLTCNFFAEEPRCKPPELAASFISIRSFSSPGNGSCRPSSRC